MLTPRKVEPYRTIEVVTPVVEPLRTVEDWYKANGADHAHCPCGCDHPQPFISEGKAWCGRCWFVEHTKVEVLPCNSADGRENCVEIQGF